MFRFIPLFKHLLFQAFSLHFLIPLGFHGDSDSKKIHLHYGRPGFDPWVGKIPWRRAWQPTPVFLPGESHGQRSLVDYSPWGHKELDTTEQLRTVQGGKT